MVRREDTGADLAQESYLRMAGVHAGTGASDGASVESVPHRCGDNGGKRLKKAALVFDGIAALATFAPWQLCRHDLKNHLGVPQCHHDHHPPEGAVSVRQEAPGWRRWSASIFHHREARQSGLHRLS